MGTRITFTTQLATLEEIIPSINRLTQKVLEGHNLNFRVEKYNRFHYITGCCKQLTADYFEFEPDIDIPLVWIADE